MNKPEFLTTSKNPFAERYDNFIGGKWLAPRSGKYFDNASPVTGQVVCKIARSDAQDVEAALDAAHAAKDAWGRTSVVERALILNRIADRMEENRGRRPGVRLHPRTGRAGFGNVGGGKRAAHPAGDGSSCACAARHLPRPPRGAGWDGVLRAVAISGPSGGEGLTRLGGCRGERRACA